MSVIKFLSFTLVFQRNISAMSQNKDVMKNFYNAPWCKLNWCIPSITNETSNLLKQCSELPQLNFNDNVDDIIRKSKEFPISFPVESIRMQNLKSRKPIDKLNKNIKSTYPILHERVLLLMAQFLVYKRQFGTSIEKGLYKEMTIPQLIDRILKKRAVTFMNSEDSYLLLNKKTGVGGWDSIGTVQEHPPLVLEDCLSYDEMKLSSMVYVSGRTVCINSGSRHNRAVVAEDDAETDAVIIGIVGPRFERESRMEYEDILVTERQNTLQNGYGEASIDSAKNQSLNMWRKIWADFYQVQSYTYDEMTSKKNVKEDSLEQYVRTKNGIFCNDVYFKRLAVTAETTLLEAEARAASQRKQAFLNVIGAGLGVWKISPHQNDVYILTFLQSIRDLLSQNLLNHVTDVNFAYIRITDKISPLLKNITNSGLQNEKKMLLLESSEHPKGGINVWLENREPSAKLTGEHEGKLLVMTYPWDGNAHPGNEFWLGSLGGSGDPAAACSTQVAELHNAHINSAVTGFNTKIVGRFGLNSIQQYCSKLSL